MEMNFTHFVHNFFILIDDETKASVSVSLQDNVAFKFQILTDRKRETVFIEAAWLQPKKEFAH